MRPSSSLYIFWLLLLRDGVYSVLAASVAKHGKRGAVATESVLCSGIGADILKQGGSAADAIVASVLCVGTVDAHHSGIGGGGFAIVRGKGKHEMIDFRETAPALSNETMYSKNSNPTASTIGGLAVGVPGELRGLEILHKKYGKLPWNLLFQPAIKLARNGFVVQGQLAGAIASAGTFILNDPEFRAVFAPNGTLLKQGDTAYRPTYAKTLETIAKNGADAFYDPKGAIARTLVATVKARGGILTLEDVKGYKALSRSPAQIKYKGYTLTSTVAPSSGTVVLGALNILSGFNLSYVDDATASGGKRDSNSSAQRLVESLKFAYGQRTVLGDPAFVANVSTLEFAFLKPDVGAELRSKIADNSTGPPSLYDPKGYIVPQDHGTSQLASADDDGVVISLTTTVNTYFGSQVMVNETGIICNNEMDDFSSPNSTNSFGYIATPSNYIRPGKRPLSSISPTIVEDSKGNFVFAVGAAGGSRIISANVQVLHHFIDQGFTAQQAINAPRLHDQIYPQVTTIEYSSPSQNVTGYNNGTVAFLASVGHNITYVAPGVSVSSAVGYRNGVFDAASDPRVPGSGAIILN